MRLWFIIGAYLLSMVVETYSIALHETTCYNPYQIEIYSTWTNMPLEVNAINVATNKWNIGKTVVWDNFEWEQNKVATWSGTHKNNWQLGGNFGRETYTITILAWSIRAYTTPSCGACIWTSSYCRPSKRISTIDLILNLHASILPLNISQARTVFFWLEFAPSGKDTF